MFVAIVDEVMDGQLCLACITFRRWHLWEKKSVNEFIMVKEERWFVAVSRLRGTHDLLMSSVQSVIFSLIFRSFSVVRLHSVFHDSRVRRRNVHLKIARFEEWEGFGGFFIFSRCQCQWWPVWGEVGAPKLSASEWLQTIAHLQEQTNKEYRLVLFFPFLFQPRTSLL